MGTCSRRSTVLLLLAVLLGAPVVAFFHATGARTNEPSEQCSGTGPSHTDSRGILAYTEHAPITITSDADFSSQGWPGSGTKADPYVIADLNITTTGDCISVANTTVYFVIRGCLLTGGTSGNGIEFVNVTNGRIEDCHIVNKYYGVVVERSPWTELVRNNVSNSQYDGVRLLDSENSTIIGNTFHNDGLESALLLNASSNTLLRDNVVTASHKYGVSVRYLSNVTIENNTITGSNNEGLWVRSVSNSTVVNNTIVGNGYDAAMVLFDATNVLVSHNNVSSDMQWGIEIDYYSSYNNITFNTIANNSAAAVYIHTSSEHNIIANNTVTYNEGDGIVVEGANFNQILNNTVISNHGNGVLISSSSHCLVRTNNVTGSTQSNIELFGSHNNTIANNTITSGSSDGVLVTQNSSNNTIANNTIRMNTRNGVLVREDSGTTTISNNLIIENGDSGISFDSSHDDIAICNTIVVNGEHGITIYLSLNISVLANEFLGDGLAILAASSEQCHHTIPTTNTVNGRPLGYFWNLTSGTIDGSQYGEVILANCTNVELRNGVFLNTSAGIELVFSSFCTVNNNTARDSFIAAGTVYSWNNTLSNNTLVSNMIGFYSIVSWNNTIADNNLSANVRGAHVEQSQDTILTGNTVSSNEDYGVLILSCTAVRLLNNTLTSYTGLGVWIQASENCTLSNNTFVNYGLAIEGTVVTQFRHFITTDNTVNGRTLGYFWSLTSGSIDGSQYGEVILANCTGVSVSGGNFHNSSMAVEIAFSTHCNLTDSTVSQNYYAIYLYASTYCTLRNNTVLSNLRNGIYIDYSSNNNVTNNTLLSNEDYGVYITGSSSSANLLYLNRLGLNLVDNALDDGANNYWNTTGIGNYWDDYNGTGVYSIPGGAGSIDYHPMVWTPPDLIAPTIDHPDDMLYEVGSTGNNITWSPSDANPATYEVLRNATIVESGPWDGGSITVNIDGLDVGVYNYTLVVYDESGNSNADTVMVTVQDTTAPIVDHPDDVQYEYGTTGHAITWNPSDATPATYEILRNGTVVESGTWDGSPITIDIDGLDVGVYNYTLIVYDESGNSNTDTVIVTVRDTTPPTIDHPPDLHIGEGSAGNTITWTPYDPRPHSYVVYRNGTVLQLGGWDGSPITINADSLSMGSYNYTLVVTDASSNSASDTVFVYVADLTAPSISHPEDVEFPVGQMGNTITWTAYDEHPFVYEVYLNGSLATSGPWNGSAIIVSLDNLPYGIYNYTAVVYDTSGNRAADTVIVTVTDTDAPTLDEPDDVEYVVGTTGNTITWNPIDASPASYELYVNGSLVDSGTWQGGPIAVNVDGLSVGTYNYTIVVYDAAGNWKSDTVFVTVLAQTGTTTATPPAGDMLTLILVIIGLFGAAAVGTVIVLVIMSRRRGTA